MYAKFFNFVLSLIALHMLSSILLLQIITGAIAKRSNQFFTQLLLSKIGKGGREYIPHNGQSQG